MKCIRDLKRWWRAYKARRIRRKIAREIERHPCKTAEELAQALKIYRRVI